MQRNPAYRALGFLLSASVALQSIRPALASAGTSATNSYAAAPFTRQALMMPLVSGFRPAQSNRPFLSWWHELLAKAKDRTPSTLNTLDLQTLAIRIDRAIAEYAEPPDHLLSLRQWREQNYAYNALYYLSRETLRLLRDQPVQHDEDEMAIFNTEMRLLRVMEFAENARAAYNHSWVLLAAGQLPFLGLTIRKKGSFLGFTKEQFLESARRMMDAGNDLVPGLFSTPTITLRGIEHELSAPPYQSLGPRSLLLTVLLSWATVSLIAGMITPGPKVSWLIETPRRLLAVRREILRSRREMGIPAQLSFQEHVDRAIKRYLLDMLSPVVDLQTPSHRYYALDVILVMPGPNRTALEHKVQDLAKRLPRSRPLPIIFYGGDWPLQDALEAEEYIRSQWSLWQSPTFQTSHPEFRHLVGLDLDQARLGVLVASNPTPGPYFGLFPTSIGIHGEAVQEQEGLVTAQLQILNLLYQAEPYREQGARCLALFGAHGVELKPRNHGVEGELIPGREDAVKWQLFAARTTLARIQEANPVIQGTPVYGLDVLTTMWDEERPYARGYHPFYPEIAGLYSGPRAVSEAQTRLDHAIFGNHNSSAQVWLGYTDSLIIGAKNILPLRRDAIGGRMFQGDAWRIMWELYHRTAVKAKGLIAQVAQQAAQAGLSTPPLEIAIRAHLLVALVIMQQGFSNESLERYKAQLLAEDSTDNHAYLEGFLTAFFNHLAEDKDVFNRVADFILQVPAPESFFSLMWTPRSFTEDRPRLEKILAAPAQTAAVHDASLAAQAGLRAVRSSREALVSYRHLMGTSFPRLWDLEPSELPILEMVAHTSMGHKLLSEEIAPRLLRAAHRLKQLRDQIVVRTSFGVPLPRWGPLTPDHLKALFADIDKTARPTQRSA